MIESDWKSNPRSSSGAGSHRVRPMVQCATYPDLLTNLPTVERVLNDHASDLGHDRIAYRNHVYRVVNLCLAVAGDSPVELEKLAVAAVFHDLGIWTNHTFDYIAPSVSLAHEHLATRRLTDWVPQVEAMIVNHHKVTSSRADGSSLVESFRRADWIDVSCGLRRFGLPRTVVASVIAAWPDAGFHRRLVALTMASVVEAPAQPSANGQVVTETGPDVVTTRRAARS